MRTILIGCVLALASPAWAGEAVDYVRDIKPILAARCYACHGGLKQQSGLRLDTGALVLKGGESGPAVMPGDSRQSLLVEKVTALDASERMPPEGKPLTGEQIALVKA